jgi:toxin ParE1/3/4
VQDIESLRSYIEKDKPKAARQAVHNIFSAAKTLALHPDIGRHGRAPNTREFIVSGTPYIIPYRVQKGALEILRVLHGAMEWPGEL